MATEFSELCSKLITKIYILAIRHNFALFSSRDILPVLEDPTLMCELCYAISDHCRKLPCPLDAILALEARGFLFGPTVAMNLKIPFVPVRKKGKLPGQTIQASYAKEYGLDELAIQREALKPGMSVLILDDLIATGGSLRATVDLVQKAGAKVAEVLTIIELKDLKGREKLQDVPITCILQY
ncbi:unnamed protein product [Soboliphyme baturini]|uniref:Adenine phosphoribosyltransferase n=1 Tax=Soboliphyme baturini TaxID=241478 RepID=A0A183ILF7_9BILA|nr:unnamed protein product [Soboliphyme baturini]